nr:hypothetical protein CFP56_22178 [Quercus suber]
MCQCGERLGTSEAVPESHESGRTRKDPQPQAYPYHRRSALRWCRVHGNMASDYARYLINPRGLLKHWRRRNSDHYQHKGVLTRRHLRIFDAQFSGHLQKPDKHLPAGTRDIEEQAAEDLVASNSFQPLADALMQYWHQSITVGIHLQLALAYDEAKCRHSQPFVVCLAGLQEVARRCVDLRPPLPPGFFASW